MSAESGFVSAGVSIGSFVEGGVAGGEVLLLLLFFGLTRTRMNIPITIKSNRRIILRFVLRRW